MAGFGTRKEAQLDRREITAEVVEQADRLAASGADAATIATRLGITEYVAGLLVRNASLPHRLGRPRPSSRRVANARAGLDATTIRRIQRMLEVGWLSHREIAREAGVSANAVGDVASGKRLAVTLSPPILSDGEEFLPRPIRCPVCRARISVVPCRACAARREMGKAAGCEAAG
jgi:hypothetical protein